MQHRARSRAAASADRDRAPGYCVSLPEDARVKLRERLRASLPTQPDGSIHLIARAWAVRGRKA